MPVLFLWTFSNRVARLASSRGPEVQETSGRRRTKFNVTSVPTLGLKFLVLRTQLEASWATLRKWYTSSCSDHLHDGS